MRNLRGETQAALALVAAVIGAGFASGREVMRFFTVFGVWSWAGCAIAALMLSGFSMWAAHEANRLNAHDLGTLCRRSLGGVGGYLASALNGMLCAVIAGAMLAAVGELAALSLPVKNAYAIGVGVSLLLGGLLAGRGLSSLSALGGWLLPACLLLYTLFLNLPAPEVAQAVTPSYSWQALPMAFAYAAMNAALSCGILCEVGQSKDQKSLLRIGAIIFLLFLLLLLGANASLYPHQADLLHESLPVVQLARSLGAVGYWLCIVVLFLAVMTTLIALLRTLYRMLNEPVPQRMRWPLTLGVPFAACIGGFDCLIENIYPALGVASTLLFLTMMIQPLFRMVRKRPVELVE
jgi:uncharacterized membrane protein YkvI